MVYTGLAQIRVRMRYPGPQNGTFWVLEVAYRSSVPDDTPDPAHQTARLIIVPDAHPIQHVSPS